MYDFEKALNLGEAQLFGLYVIQSSHAGPRHFLYRNTVRLLMIEDVSQMHWAKRRLQVQAIK